MIDATRNVSISVVEAVDISRVGLMSANQGEFVWFRTHSKGLSREVFAAASRNGKKPA